MTRSLLPHTVDPFRFADQGIHLEGDLKISDLHRLKPSLASDEGLVRVDMLFDRDEEKNCIIKGQLHTNVILQCQRCMETYNYEILGDFLSCVVNSETEIASLPSDYDAVIAIEGSLQLADMIEDELIVSLPVVPMHDQNVCKVKLPYESSEDDAQKDNPFNVIEILRSKGKEKK